VSNRNEKVIFSLEEKGDDQKDRKKTHHLFCEMDELQANLEWKEAARWLKFEEDVDDAGRWSKPHVATLSLHSLLELRNCLTKGAVYLEFKGEDMVSIVEELLDNVVNDGFLDESKREFVKNALLLKHIHQHEKEFQNSLNNGEKKSLFSKKPSSQNINETNGIFYFYLFNCIKYLNKI